MNITFKNAASDEERISTSNYDDKNLLIAKNDDHIFLDVFITSIAVKSNPRPFSLIEPASELLLYSIVSQKCPLSKSFDLIDRNVYLKVRYIREIITKDKRKVYILDIEQNEYWNLIS